MAGGVAPRGDVGSSADDEEADAAEREAGIAGGYSARFVAADMRRAEEDTSVPAEPIPDAMALLSPLADAPAGTVVTTISDDIAGSSDEPELVWYNGLAIDLTR